MLIAGKYDVPDECPEKCALRPDTFYQGCICTRCPVLICKKDEDGLCLVGEEDFREDWAEEWERFFRDGTIPELPLQTKEKKDG